MKVIIWDTEGYTGLDGIDFPVVVDARIEDWGYRKLALVSERELSRVGASAYQADESYIPSFFDGLYFENFTVE